MKTLYLQCQMGAAGDMLLAALMELLPDPAAFLKILNSLSLPGVEFSAQKRTQYGIVGTHICVTVHGQEEEHSHAHHCHTTLAEIHSCIDQLALPEAVRCNAKAVYDRIAQAESLVHGQPVEAVHFHEVGTWDAVADVVGVCLAMELLAPDRVLASAVHVGSGSVRCAHGILPVPAPATAQLLQGVPIYSDGVDGELCTPTGAALLTQFVSQFGDMPVFRIQKTGYGMGTRTFDRPNCIRAFLGDSPEPSGEEIAVLRCNLDDMTGEALGFAQEVLLQAGALDVYTAAIGMKKSRPGVLLTCLCPARDAERFAELMLQHTTTLGVRQSLCHRYTLPRTVHTVQTPYGSIRIKSAGIDGREKSKPEYEDVAAAARANHCSLDTILCSIPGK